VEPIIVFLRPILHLARHPIEGEMIEFLTDMPTNTKIFLTVAVLGLAATFVVLRGLL
jgi:hypothetical protein